MKMAERKPYMSEISLALLHFKKRKTHIWNKMAERKPYMSEISLALLDFKERKTHIWNKNGRTQTIHVRDFFSSAWFQKTQNAYLK